MSAYFYTVGDAYDLYLAGAGLVSPVFWLMSSVVFLSASRQYRDSTLN
jgi:hypothetical protein